MAVIPARGGSKGLPGKNIRLLLNRPLLDWTISAALEAGLPANDIVVTTDDAAIASVAAAWHVKVSFPRPAHLATDDASTLSVLQHVVAQIEAVNGSRPYDWILLLQPTSPLRDAGDIQEALSLAQRYGDACDSVVAVTERPAEHPKLAKCIINGYLAPFSGATLEGVRRQDCKPSAVFNNGAIYLTKRSILMDRGEILGARSIPMVMSREKSIDIDDEFDLLIAEAALKRFGRGMLSRKVE